MAPDVLYHGGVGGHWRGGVILPNMAAHRYVDGCAECAAQAAGKASGHMDPPTPPDWVYATADREYSRYYASRAMGGWLYKVRLEGDVGPSAEDPPQFPTWRGRRAVVLGVPERNITLTMAQRRRLYVRWGGTPEEFAEMVASVRAPPPPSPVRDTGGER